MASISTRDVGGQRRYDVNYREPDGRRRRKTFTRKKPAEDFSKTVEADKLRGTYIDRDSGRVTFREYVEQTWLPAQTFEATTREGVEQRLRRHIHPCSVG